MLLPSFVIAIHLLSQISFTAGEHVPHPGARDHIAWCNSEEGRRLGCNFAPRALERRDDQSESDKEEDKAWCLSSSGKEVGCAVIAGVAIVAIAAGIKVSVRAWRNWSLTKAQAKALLEGDTISLQTWQDLPPRVRAQIKQAADPAFQQTVELWEGNGLVPNEYAVAKKNIEDLLENPEPAIRPHEKSQRANDWRKLDEDTRKELRERYDNYNEGANFYRKEYMKEWDAYDLKSDAKESGVPFEQAPKARNARSDSVDSEGDIDIDYQPRERGQTIQKDSTGKKQEAIDQQKQDAADGKYQMTDDQVKELGGNDGNLTPAEVLKKQEAEAARKAAEAATKAKAEFDAACKQFHEVLAKNYDPVKHDTAETLSDLANESFSSASKANNWSKETLRQVKKKFFDDMGTTEKEFLESVAKTKAGPPAAQPQNAGNGGKEAPQGNGGKGDVVNTNLDGKKLLDGGKQSGGTNNVDLAKQYNEGKVNVADPAHPNVPVVKGADGKPVVDVKNDGKSGGGGGKGGEIKGEPLKGPKLMEGFIKRDARPQPRMHKVKRHH